MDRSVTGTKRPIGFCVLHLPERAAQRRATQLHGMALALVRSKQTAKARRVLT
jgi:hypothetical protein